MNCSVSIGPEMPGWGSWDWVGKALLEWLGPAVASSFAAWDIPDADLVVVVKHAPDADWFNRVARRSQVVYCPIDWYSCEEDIVTDAEWLARCSLIIVHCHRLERYFSRFAKTAYLDHPLKYAIPTRQDFRMKGDVLWVGARSNLPPLVDWVNRHPLRLTLKILTNPESPGEIPSPSSFGFRRDRDVQVYEWTPSRHLEFTAEARVALDVKGDDFRSRNKPPAKALDFIASGLPIALTVGSSSAEHIGQLGLSIPTPLDHERWFSAEYWKETRQLGQNLWRDLAPERVALRARALLSSVIAERHRSPIVFTRSPSSGSRLPTKTGSTNQVDGDVVETRRSPLRLYGLMVTKDDHPILGDWCRDQLPLYDAVVCLDGSVGEESARIASRFDDKLIYLRERDFTIPHRTNHGLRRVVHDEIVRRFGLDHWVMCCHPDEFCFHDPRKIAGKADAEGYDHVQWFVPQFYPHPEELSRWDLLRDKFILERHRYYHWDRGGTGQPWIEDRLYKCVAGVAWDDYTHDTVRPHGLTRLASFRPILRHFKIIEPNPDRYEVTGDTSRHRGRWEASAGRPGLPFPVRCLEDFFVAYVPGFGRCNRFDGSFPQSWNMGAEYQVDSLGAELTAWQRYRQIAERVTRGDFGVKPALEALDGVDTEPTLRALVHNDLAVLAIIRGETEVARRGLARALELDPGCGSAHANLAFLDSGRDLPTMQQSVPKSRPVRVALLSLLFNWPSTGGGNIHSAELAKFLAAAGYDVEHLFARYDPWRIGRVSQSTPHPASALEFGPAEWTATGIVARYRGVVEKLDPDFVILTDSWNLKPLLAEAAGGRPYILRLQALECLCPLNNIRLVPQANGRPTQCTRHQLATPTDCARCVQEFQHTSGDLHRAERALAGVGTVEYRNALFRAFSEATAVLAVNPLTAALVEPYARRTEVVTAGIDPARFPWPFPADRIPPSTADRFRILFAGLTSEWIKGFAVLEAACRRLWQRRQDFELVVTDEPPLGKIDPFARYIGWQSQEDLPGHMAAADIVAVPAVAQEALGRTAVEAMAAGKPVVASRLGGLPFTVVDGATGLLFSPSDEIELAEKMTLLLDHPELRARLGVEGRKRFEENYAWPVIIDRHYRPLLGEPMRRE